MAIGKTILDELLEKFLSLNQDEIFDEIINDRGFEKFVTDIIKNDQLQEGIDGNGQIIGFYSPATEKITNGRKKAGEPYTLEDTGAFYDSFHIDPLSDGFEIDADAQKNFVDNLFDKYGEDIIGLTDESLQKVIEFTKEKFFSIIQRQITIV